MKGENSSRRRFICDSIVAGCALVMPAIFSGCDNRPGTSTDELKGSEAAPRQSSQSNASAAQSDTKINKQDAQYQSTPHGSEKCSDCQMYNAANKSCLVVEGKIDPDGWCTMWVKKSA